MSEEEKTAWKSKVKGILLRAGIPVIMTVVGAVIGTWAAGPAAPEGEEKPSYPGEYPAPGELALPDVTDEESEPIDLLQPDTAEEAMAEQFIADGFLKTDQKPQLEGDGSDRAEDLAGYLAWADDQLRGSNYDGAARAYHSIAELIQGEAKPGVVFRQALCAEALGQYAEALSRYQEVLQTWPDTFWHDAAQVSVIRNRLEMGQREPILAEVLPAILLADDELSPAARRDLVHLASLSLVQEDPSAVAGRLLDDSAPVVADWVIDPMAILDDAVNYNWSAPTDSGERRFVLLQTSDPPAPEGTFVRVTSGSGTIDQLVEGLLERTGFNSRITSQAARRLRNRRRRVAVNDQSLALLLDGLCAQCNVHWYADEETIHITIREEIDDHRESDIRKALTERLLRLALLQAPESRQAEATRMRLGAFLFSQERYSEAARLFRQQLDSSPGSDVEAIAAFNLGKSALQLEDVDEAIEAFVLAMDSPGVQSGVRTAAYLYHGRLLMERAEFDVAVSTLVRGLSLAEKTPQEPEAALLLSAAYLLADNPHGANEILMKRRDLLKQSDYETTGAFLSGMARFRAAVLESRREREGRAVVDALMTLQSRPMMRAILHYLAGFAGKDLGLRDQAVAAWEETLRSARGAGLRQRALLQLALLYRQEQRYSEAEQLLAALEKEALPEFREVAALQRARVAADQEQTDKVQQLCISLLQTAEDPTVRKQALVVLGRSYQQDGHYELAVRCFSGLAPSPELTRKLRKDPPPSESGEAEI